MNTSKSKPRVAVIGLGIMGAGMARNLLKARFPLTVYNRNSEKTAPFAVVGARVAESPRAAADNSDVVISMVSDDTASRGVWLGEDGALAGSAPGTVLIESSTLSVEWIQELAASAASRECELIDAPVTGSRPHAAAGELLFLAGGSDEAIQKVRLVLDAMSRAIVHVGPTGAGALLKLINNFMCGVQTASLAEAVALIERGGLDRSKALEVLANGAPGSPMVKGCIQRMTDRDYSNPNFFLRLMAKDLSYACNEGSQRSLDMAMATAARSIFQQAIDAGFGESDLTAVVEQFHADS
jgi:3-hydroxyisobutyrate dehydrogenase